MVSEYNGGDGRLAGFAIAVLLVLTLVFTLATMAGIFLLTRNLFIAEYSTASIVFDAVGIGMGAKLAAAIPLSSSFFYALFWIMVTGGLVKIVLVGFVIGAFMEMVTSIDVGTKLLMFRMHRLKDHIILCGYSALAEGIIRDLKRSKRVFTVVERDLQKYELLKDMGYNAIYGEFTRDDVLRDASILSARTVIFTSDNDYENLLGIVTARYLNGGIQIMTRAKQENSVSKMHRAGAGLCVVPEVLAGLEIGEIIESRILGE
ncbi:MAG: NAD-binding protein [Candidatus Marsarchaeota archaeon]|nr:NAD-binding protein [Candidatus Marsarchaeota archaeon]